ncbi:UNVERIFIED_CONTAM: hypothetical protein FKN15_017287 [Acipenser sinensis]
MSEKVPQEDSRASFAKRIDPKKEPLTPEQVAFIRRAELEQWKKNCQKLRGRNIFTGLAIGGLVLGICNLSFMLFIPCFAQYLRFFCTEIYLGQ